ncbi:hypothetical protein [Paragemmobacter straminiformis]|uniref:PDZ domain-containing protein n=1 Tax=Paragemmobacter straminiformis TaxID=2045119 RepID=A0A842I5C2_9RHOB|nr:hypothetical protein [Gemmobacter straminiformis]MBC2834765.1 hypothetical protein [Gemmobacter straminiformis]
MTETTPLTLRLKDLPAASGGRALGLRAGDVLAAINGRAFQGDAALLARRMAEGGGKPVALTFQRGAAELTVLATRADLGLWEAVPALPEDGARRRIDPALLRNWEVLRAADGSYDLYPLSLPSLALIAPQLWLAQMRLWLPFAMLVAAVVAGGIVHPLLALVVQAAGAVHLRHAFALYLRMDRRARGLGFGAVLAARSEAEAHATYLRLQPEDHYLFAAKPRSAEPVTV